MFRWIREFFSGNYFSRKRKSNSIEEIPAKAVKLTALEVLASQEEDNPEQIVPEQASIIGENARLASLEDPKLTSDLLEHKNLSNALEEPMQESLKVAEVPDTDADKKEKEYHLPELASNDELMITNALQLDSGEEVLSEKFNLKITRKDMNGLNLDNWLNDQVINFYMHLLMERGKQESMPNVYAFNTFFYQNLVNRRFSSLRSWTKKVDLFSFDIVFVPVHLRSHWCMSVIDFESKEVRYYDSLKRKNNNCLKALLAYLKAESLDKKNLEYDMSDWKMINVENIPQQMNGNDCGVFACIFAEHLARKAPFLFCQYDIPYFRKKMVLEILKGELLT